FPYCAGPDLLDDDAIVVPKLSMAGRHSVQSSTADANAFTTDAACVALARDVSGHDVVVLRDGGQRRDRRGISPDGRGDRLADDGRTGRVRDRHARLGTAQPARRAEPAASVLDRLRGRRDRERVAGGGGERRRARGAPPRDGRADQDRKSTRLNSSHVSNSYA